MIKSKEVEAMFRKIDKGIWEYRKEYAMHITKKILIGIWTVTIFPLLLCWMFITKDK